MENLWENEMEAEAVLYVGLHRTYGLAGRFSKLGDQNKCKPHNMIIRSVPPTKVP